MGYYIENITEDIQYLDKLKIQPGQKISVSELQHVCGSFYELSDLIHNLPKGFSVLHIKDK